MDNKNHQIVMNGFYENAKKSVVGNFLSKMGNF